MKLISHLTLLMRAGTFALLAALSGCLWTEAASAVQLEGIDPATRKPTSIEADNKALATAMRTMLKGESTYFDRLFGGPLGECKHFTADGAVLAEPGMLISVYAFNATANDDFILYDNASAASGTKLLDALNVAAGFTAIANYPAAAANGIYLDLTTAGAMQVEVCFL